MSESGSAAAAFLSHVLRHELGVEPPARVLDFGCGAGSLVGDLASVGYDARGCDVVEC